MLKAFLSLFKVPIFIKREITYHMPAVRNIYLVVTLITITNEQL